MAQLVELNYNSYNYNDGILSEYLLKLKLMIEGQYEGIHLN